MCLIRKTVSLCLLPGSCFFPLMALAQAEGDYAAFQTGNWSQIAIWKQYVPNALGDLVLEPATTRPGQENTSASVYILDGVQVALDETPDYPIQNLNIGEFSSGSLVVHSGAARSLTVNGSMVLLPGASFSVGNGAAGIVHNISIKKDLLNEGTLVSKGDLPYCIFDFNGNEIQSIGPPDVKTQTSFAVLKINCTDLSGVTLYQNVIIDTLLIGDNSNSSIFSDGGKEISSALKCYLFESAKYYCYYPNLQWENFYANYLSGTTVSYASDESQTVAPLKYSTLQFEGSGLRILSGQNGDTIKIFDLFSLDGNNSIQSIGSTIEFNGSSQNIPGFTYPNLVLSGSGNKTLQGAITVNGQLTIRSNATLNTSSRDITIKGNWVNEGSFSPGTRTVTFANTDSITINSGGTGSGKSFNNLTTTGSGAIALAGNHLRVGGTLSKSAGAFYTNSRKLSATTLTLTGGSLHGSTDSLIVTNLNLNGGTLVAPSGPLVVKANWANNGSGTFQPGTHTVYFTKDSTLQTLSAGGSDFHHITLSGAGTLALNSDLTIKGDLTIQSGTLNGNARTLNLKGNWNNLARFLPGAGRLNLSGTNPQTVSASQFYDLEVNNPSGVTLLGYDTITHSLIPGSGTLNTGGFLILQSDSNETARITALGSTAAISGAAVVERYIGTRKRAWRLMALPVTGVSIRDAWAGAPANANAPAGETVGAGTLITGHGYADGSSAAQAGFDWFTGLGLESRSSIRYYANDSWASATNTPNILSPPDRQGYMLFIRGDRTQASVSAKGITTLKPRGTLKTGTQQIPVSQTYEVVGNPFASPVDLDAMYQNTGNSNVITRNFWIWDPALGNYGAFRALSYAEGAYSITGGGAAADYLKVQSGQAFFVEKNGSGGNLSIEENDKVASTGVPLFQAVHRHTTTQSRGSQATETAPSLQIYLVNADNLLYDGVVIRYGNGYQQAPTEVFDVAKLNNFNENLALVRDGRYLSIESLPPAAAGDTVWLSCWNLSKQPYAFQVAANNLGGAGLDAYIVDRYTGLHTPLPLTGSPVTCPFVVTNDAASAAAGRFLVVWKAAAPLAEQRFISEARVLSNGIGLAWSWQGAFAVKAFQVERSSDGSAFREVYHFSGMPDCNPCSGEWEDTSPRNGWNYYRIRYTLYGGAVHYGRVMTAFWKNNPEIRIFPAIAAGGRCYLQVNQPGAGNFRINVFGPGGRLLTHEGITHKGGNGRYALPLQHLRPGLYWIQVYGTEGGQTVFKVIIPE